jgi:hypothetical protein
MFRLNSNDHGLVDPTPTVTISLCAVSALLFFMFYLITGYSHASTQQMAVYFPLLSFSREEARQYLAAAVLAVSLGLITSVVRYRRPIASTFAVVTIAEFLGVIVPFVLLSIGRAFASPSSLGEAIGAALLIVFRNFCIFTIVFSSCAVGGCIAGHVIQELSKRRVASPAIPSLITLAIALLGCAAAMAGTSFVPDQEIREAIVHESQAAYFRTVLNATRTGNSPYGFNAGRTDNSRYGADICACPDNIKSNGDRCGASSAHDLSGSASPLCYTSEVTPDMVARYRARRSNR